MHIDWFLVDLAAITIPLVVWGYWIVTSDADKSHESKENDRVG